MPSPRGKVTAFSGAVSCLCQLAPKGSHTVYGGGEKRWSNPAASQIEAALFLICATSERAEGAKGKEKQNETRLREGKILPQRQTRNCHILYSLRPEGRERKVFACASVDLRKRFKREEGTTGQNRKEMGSEGPRS